jgi:hypothetical protein
MRKKQYIVVEHVPMVFLEVVGLAKSGADNLLHSAHTLSENEIKAINLYP